MQGKLYLCATPIGNLEDITLRVLRTLREVDLIAAEDTRNSIKLLNHFEIKTPMTSYHDLSGLASRRFAFEAFLPRDKKERSAILDSLKLETRTIILYEAPHHLLKTLQELYNVLGDRPITLCRELTKKYETVFTSTLSEALSFYQQQAPKGEFVLVIQGKSLKELQQEQHKNWENISLEEHMAQYENQGIARKEAMKLVAKDRGISKREVYAKLLSE